MNNEKYPERFFGEKYKTGFHGRPIATIAYYGPDNETATKVAVGIVDKNDEVVSLRRWPVKSIDVRIDRMINQEILSFLKQQNVRSVVIAGKIIGCPHEEGTDYPEGSTCPECPYWAKIDRWTGEVQK